LEDTWVIRTAASLARRQETRERRKRRKWKGMGSVNIEGSSRKHANVIGKVGEGIESQETREGGDVQTRNPWVPQERKIEAGHFGKEGEKKRTGCSVCEKGGCWALRNQLRDYGRKIGMVSGRGGKRT